MNGAFNGFGIPQDLRTEDSTIKNDPYLLKLRDILSQDNIMNDYTREETLNLQQELLYPYLNFFLRNDKNNYYKNLFFSRGLTKDEDGSLKDGLVLSDLIKLRIHSDDLRGDGQEIRRIEHFPDKSYGMNFMSSGTTKGTNGPVNLYRSNISLDLSRKTNGNLIDWSLGKKIDGGECLFHMAPEMTNFLAFAAIGSDFLRDRGLKVGFGAKIKKGPKDSTIWQRIGPNIKEMRKYPFSRLSGPANILVVPARHSASISVKLLQEMGGATIIGPILTGIDKPIQICSTVSSVTDILNMAVIAACNIR